MRSLDKGLYKTTVMGDELINLFGAENVNAGQAAVKNRTEVSFSGDIDLANVIRDSLRMGICC